MRRKKRKNQTSTPRRKRFKRPQRLDAAKAWLASYTGNKVVKAYRKHFGVNWQCAFTELEMLGVEIDPEYKHQVLQSVAAQAEAKLAEEIGIYQDERFAFIAGYTSWGFPYGITWEEMEAFDEEEESFDEEKFSSEAKNLKQ